MGNTNKKAQADTPPVFIRQSNPKTSDKCVDFFKTSRPYGIWNRDLTQNHEIVPSRDRFFSRSELALQSSLLSTKRNSIAGYKESLYYNRDYQMGIGPTAIVPKTVTQPPAIPPYDASVDEKAKNAISIWDRHYLKNKLHPGDLESFNNRLARNTSAFERRAEEARLKRLKESNNLLLEKSTPQAAPSIHSFLNYKNILADYKKNDVKYFPPKAVRPELTPPMLELIHTASKPTPSNQILVEHDGVQILRKDIQTLLGLNWLNDEIINFYMGLIAQRGEKAGNKRVYAFNTFFYPKLRETGYNSIKRWTRKVDIFSYHFLLIPVHLGNHWCLALVDFNNRKISYYDSLGGHTNGCCDTLLDYLRYESNDKKKQDFDDENWRLVDSYSEGIPQQKNCSDCGVFACTYAEYLTREAKMSFSQEDMPYFRKKMIYEIIQKKLLE